MNFDCKKTLKNFKTKLGSSLIKICSNIAASRLQVFFANLHVAQFYVQINQQIKFSPNLVHACQMLESSVAALYLQVPEAK